MSQASPWGRVMPRWSVAGQSALAIASINVAEYSLKDRLTLYKGDLVILFRYEES